MNVLITGGAGFIGSRLIERLLRRPEARLICLDDYNDYYEPALKRTNTLGFAAEPRVRMVETSFCDAPRMERLFAEEQVEFVVHLGAYAGVRYSLANPFPYQQHNVGGTLALLEAARKHPVRRFVLASSSTVYGRNAVAPFQEDAPLGVPLSPYGASKRAAETFGLTYHDLYQVPVVIVRPFSVYGPRLRPDLALSIFTEAILHDRPVPLFGDGSIRRDFTYIDDLCDGLEAILTADGCLGEAINLGHDEPIAMREVIATLERTLGRAAAIHRLPAKEGEMPVTHADLSKAKRLLNYAPKTSFDDGVRAFCDWYRKHGSADLSGQWNASRT
ncbi:MAG: GDP-mannose 4,6-dehydratase [Planctomycetia bacterium]|nr:GDP-mannose 4,6-dehydratase [Planctomycetia bacterium]